MNVLVYYNTDLFLCFSLTYDPSDSMLINKKVPVHGFLLWDGIWTLDTITRLAVFSLFNNQNNLFISCWFFIEIDEAEFRKRTHSLLIRLSICESKHRLLSASLICVGAWATCTRWSLQKQQLQCIFLLSRSGLLPGHCAFNTQSVSQFVLSHLFNVSEQLVAGALIWLQVWVYKGKDS